MNVWMTAAGVVGGLILTLTGVYLGIASSGAPPVQLNQLVHVAAGWLLLVPMIVATLRHRKVRGDRPSGLIAFALMGVVLVSGLVHSAIAFAGQPGPAWLLSLHLWSSVAFGAVTAGHIVVAWRKRPKAKWARRWAAPALVGAMLALAAAIGFGLWLDGEQATAAPTGYAMPFGDKPFRPANATVEGGGFVAPERLAGSARCRTCHEDIYVQWSESMHRYAATDPHVDTGIRWFQRDNGAAAGRMCAGCHNPIGLLAGWYDPATSPPDIGTPAHDEGISCLSCHAVTSIGEDPLGNGSYHINPPQMPLPGGAMGDALINLDVGAHKAAMMKRPLMQTSLFCASCHQQYFSEELGGAGPGVSFNQYPEWLDSHYAKDGPDKKTCNDCHMPLVASNDPAAIDGKIHSHRFIGANHGHAVISGHEEQARLTLEFLKQGVTLAAEVAPQQTRPGHVEVAVTVSNVGAGHRFPSGTTDISEAWLEIVVGDPDKPLWASGLLDHEHYLDPDAHQWRTVYVDVNNVPVDLHNLAVIADTTVDTHILPGERDTARFAIPLKALAGAAQVPLRARLRMRRANQRWNDWLFNFDGRTIPVTDVHELTLTITPGTLELPPAETTTAQADAQPLPPAPSGMVAVPGGPAIIGSTEGDADEAPVHTIDVPGFYLDRFPVTNAQYRQFVVATGIRGPQHKLPWAERYNWKGQDYPIGTQDQPVVLVNRQEAEAYCRWRGARLPREVEWEKAARGPDGQRYPWGETWEAGRCDAVANQDIPPRVGMCPNRQSPYGAQEMIGGVFEWVADFYRAYDRTHLHPNANEWITTFGDVSYVLRGAPAGHAGPGTTAASRSGHADNMRAKIGFRCAASPGQVPPTPATGGRP